MSALWPLALPRGLSLNASRKPIDQRVFSEMDVGPPKIRRRSSVSLVEHTGIRMNMRTDQADALESFFDVTLNGGADKFDWDEPWPGAGLRTFYFMDVPSRVPLDAGGMHGAVAMSFSLLEVTVLP